MGTQPAQGTIGTGLARWSRRALLALTLASGAALSLTAAIAGDGDEVDERCRKLAIVALG